MGIQAIQRLSGSIIKQQKTNTAAVTAHAYRDLAQVCSLSYSLCVAGKQEEGLGGLGYNGMTSAIADEINANKMLNY